MVRRWLMAALLFAGSLLACSRPEAAGDATGSNGRWDSSKVISGQAAEARKAHALEAVHRKLAPLGLPVRVRTMTVGAKLACGWVELNKTLLPFLVEQGPEPSGAVRMADLDLPEIRRGGTPAFPDVAIESACEADGAEIGPAPVTMF